MAWSMSPLFGGHQSCLVLRLLPIFRSMSFRSTQCILDLERMSLHIGSHGAALGCQVAPVCTVLWHKSCLMSAQADILEVINDEYGFEYEQETPWHEVFAEPPAASPKGPDGLIRTTSAAAPVSYHTLADFLANADLPESDSDDSSYR